ncbi:hypothetical protein AAE478_006844 [Parahypoxylon ruwenzoriense]
MSARLHSKQIPTPLKSDSPRQPNTLKRRLFPDEDEDEDEDEHDENVRPPSPKRRVQHHSVAPLFDKYKRFRTDEDGPSGRGHHQRLSTSPDPESPLVTEIDERYARLRATLHSASLAGLEEAESELTARTDDNVRTNRQKLATLEGQMERLLAPLQNLTVDYTATGEDGRQRTAAVAIRDAAEALAEIEALGNEVLYLQSLQSRKGSRPGGGSDAIEAQRRRLDDEREEVDLVAIETKGISADVATEFDEDLDEVSKDVAEEMEMYEKASPQLGPAPANRRPERCAD